MSCVHYKFRSLKSFEKLTFDGLGISLQDLKKSIMEKKKIKETEFALTVENADTKEVYTDQSELIPKNTTVIVARVPLGGIAKDPLQAQITEVPKNVGTSLLVREICMV